MTEKKTLMTNIKMETAWYKKFREKYGRLCSTFLRRCIKLAVKNKEFFDEIIKNETDEIGYYQREEK